MAKTKRSFLQRLIGKESAEETQEVNYQNLEESQSFEPQPLQENMEVPINQEAASYPAMAQEEAPEQGHNSWVADQEGQLTIDVYQTETEIVIKSTIAGVKPEDLDVQINNDMVTIKGERRQEELVSEENYYYQECYWGSFSRSIILPVDIQANKAEAAMKNGILTIRLPKTDSAQSRKIQVRGF
jgi:HSP20 family protein